VLLICHTQLRRYSRAKAQALQQLRDFLRSKEVPNALEKKVVKWVDFDFGHKYDYFNQLSVLEAMPAEYQLELLHVINSDIIDKLAIFDKISALTPEELLQFQSEVCREMVPRTYIPLHAIAQVRIGLGLF
jgi:hypothetical protein